MALLPSGPLVRGPQPSSVRRYGLLDVVTPGRPDDPNWVVGGVNWEDFLCTSAESFLDVCAPASGFTKPRNNDLNFCHSDPFNVIASFDCSTGGRRYTSGEAFEIARQRLLAWEGHEVERALWTGVTQNGDINPSLANGSAADDDGFGCDIDVIDLTGGGGAVNPVDAISLLEDGLADLVPGGIIHVPASLAAYLSSFMLFNTDGNRAYTPAGNSYVVGAGYPGTGPAGVAPSAGTAWVFATGPVAVWRSDLYLVPNDLSEAVNRSINDVTVYAERYYAVGFSCSVLAVNVDLTCSCG